MTEQEYTQAVLRTLSDKFDPEEVQKIKDELHAVVGLCTESGELLDAFKKHIYYGKELDRTNVIEEIGDIFWYSAVLCHKLDISFEEVWRINKNKLDARYPEGFTSDSAINRDLEKEREILED